MEKLKKNAARVLAMLLVLTFCFSLLPTVSVSAYATADETTERSSDAGTTDDNNTESDDSSASEQDEDKGSETDNENGSDTDTDSGDSSEQDTGDSSDDNESEDDGSDDSSEQDTEAGEETYSRGEPKDPEYETVAGAGDLNGVAPASEDDGIMALDDEESIEAMQFSWNGTSYTMMTNTSGSDTGISWTCDADGDFTMTFTQSGTLIITLGNVTNSSVKLIGGGAGGSSAYTGHGGNGGGGGSTVTSEVTIEEGISIAVTIGAGGTGGSPSSVGPEYTITGNSGTAGGDTSFGDITASGGTPGGGGAGKSGTGAGSDAADGSLGGGGGGSVSTFYETDCGNFRWGNYSCFICGANVGYYSYSVSGWTPLYQNASSPGDVSGGAGDNGGGTGGYPQNQHGHGPRDGGDGAANTGAGGGGAYATWTYCLGSGYGHSATGSAEKLGYAGSGGDGGSGVATLSGHAEAKARVQIIKSSANSAMTTGNSCYSLAGAVYGVYSDADCTELVEELTTDEDGYAKSEALERAVYYVKEITAPQGYLADDTVYTADGTNGGTIKLNVKDTPANDPVLIRITKITDDTATTLPSLAGTQFTVKFYGGQYSSVDELPSTATRTWVIETKALTINGKITYLTMLSDSYKVSGDEFYTNAGVVSFPLGTVTIQETKPAEGYTTIGGYAAQAGTTIADASGIILLHITEEAATENSAGIDYGNEYTKTDKPIYGGVSVQKFDEETSEAAAQGGASLEGAKFSIVSMNEDDITVNGKVYSNGSYSGVRISRF